MGSTYDFGKGTELQPEERVVGRWNFHTVNEYAKAIVAPHKLLYVCYAGSHLHGTTTPKSDYDFKGIFLPNVDFCYLDEQPKHFRYSSGNDNSRNTCDDVDFELWSVQEWLKLVGKGDSNALSVLFSSFNADMVMFCDVVMTEILENYHYLYNPNNVAGFTGFSKSSVCRYYHKGSHLKVIENVFRYLELAGKNLGGFDEKTRLRDLDLNELIELCHIDSSRDKNYLSLIKRDDKLFLKLLTKEHQDTIFISEFIERLSKEHKKYGHRAHSAKNMDGNDWKSLSHSIRALFEAHEMLCNGYIKYPLSSSKFLLDVKNGNISIVEFEELYDELEKLVNDITKNHQRVNYFDKKIVNQLILNLYKIREKEDSYE